MNILTPFSYLTGKLNKYIINIVREYLLPNKIRDDKHIKKELLSQTFMIKFKLDKGLTEINDKIMYLKNYEYWTIRNFVI